jgi:hypothetical protein
MCDYSLHNVKTRPAKVDDKLTTRSFGTGTRGFAASEDARVAVCLMPGTELSFTDEVRRQRFWPWSGSVIEHKTAIFRQINKEVPTSHRPGIPRWDHRSLDLFGEGSTSHGAPAAGNARRRQSARTGRGQGLAPLHKK